VIEVQRKPNTRTENRRIVQVGHSSVIPPATSVGHESMPDVTSTSLPRTPVLERAQSLVAGLKEQRVRWPAVLLGAMIACLAAYFVARTFGPPTKQFDLRIYFSAVNFWFDGHDIYDYAQPDPIQISLGFTYPPVAALMMTPMAVLPFVVVQMLTVAAIMVAGFFCVYLAVRALNRTRPADAWQLTVAVLITVAAFATQPFAQTMQFGQVNLFLALLVIVDALVLLPRNSRFGGVLIGVAMAIKLTPGVFLLFLLVNKRWRETAVALGSAAAVTILSAALTPAASWRFFTSLIWDTERVGLLDNAANQSLNGLLARLVAPLDPPRLLWFVLVIALTVVVAIRARRAVVAGDQLLALTLVGSLGILISPVSWVHHAVWGVLGLLLLGRHLIDRVRNTADRGWVRWIWPAVLTFGAYVVWCVDTRDYFQLPTAHYQHATAIQLLGSNLIVLWLLVSLFALPIRRTDPAADQLPADSTTYEPARNTSR
jgi:alpha-1,2-mannosyltransferase